MNEGRERYEASLNDYDAMLDDTEIDEDETRDSRTRYRCVDRMCGALDCSNCYPASFDAQEEEDLQI